MFLLPHVSLDLNHRHVRKEEEREEEKGKEAQGAEAQEGEEAERASGEDEAPAQGAGIFDVPFGRFGSGFGISGQQPGRLQLRYEPGPSGV